MTIAISIKINDGLVLASDSASTVLGQTPTGQLSVLNVYNNAIKLFNLKKGLPIGCITWGSGAIGQASVSTILKDLRERFTGSAEPAYKGWKLDADKYTIDAVATRVKEFVYDDLYVKAFKDFPQKPSMGFIVAGYSPNAPMADEFQIDIQNGQCNGPRKLRQQHEVGMTWAGEPEALNRLITGRGGNLPALLQQHFGVQPEKIQEALALFQQNLQVPLILPAMPLQDAIELAEFMVDVTIQFSRFKLGPPTVGGPTEIAAISKHEGFRWIRRKYYFSRDLNPEEQFTRVHDVKREGE